MQRQRVEAGKQLGAAWTTTSGPFWSSLKVKFTS